MCLAPPARVIEVHPGLAVVDRGGERLTVQLYLLEDEVHPGDWLAIQAQRFAVARLTEAEAREMAETFEGIRAHLEATHA